MTEQLESPPIRVFISHSRGAAIVTNWVALLAKRLECDGLDVGYDKNWNRGDSWRQRATSELRRADVVIVVCTAAYKKKCRDRLGGVGFEVSLIKAYGIRSIPLMLEPDWEDVRPGFIAQDAIYVDATDLARYEEYEYASLLQTIRKCRLPGRRDIDDWLVQVEGSLSTLVAAAPGHQDPMDLERDVCSTFAALARSAEKVDVERGGPLELLLKNGTVQALGSSWALLFRPNGQRLSQVEGLLVTCLIAEHLALLAEAADLPWSAEEFFLGFGGWLRTYIADLPSSPSGQKSKLLYETRKLLKWLDGYLNSGLLTFPMLGVQVDPNILDVARTLVFESQHAEEHSRYDLLRHTWRRASGKLRKLLLQIPCRFLLWRALHYLMVSRHTQGFIRSPEDQKIKSLLSHRWSFRYRAEIGTAFALPEPAPTYRGFLVHVPAGEHAMRNQRVARNLSIRTIALEKEERRSSPGYREADERVLFRTYGEVDRHLERVLGASARLLAHDVQCAWVILEAQEYSQHSIIESVKLIEERLRAARGIVGRIEVDSTALLANRKDLTRAAALRVTRSADSPVRIPQPDFRVLAGKAQQEVGRSISTLWSNEIEKSSLVIPVDSWDERPSWTSSLRQALEDIGGAAVVKPVTTEFLKGSTFFGSDMTPHELDAAIGDAWLRHRNTMPSEPVIVERMVDPAFELHTLVVERNPEEFVDFPTIYYDCIGFDLNTGHFRRKAEPRPEFRANYQPLRDLPIAFERSWTVSADRPEDLEAAIQGWPGGVTADELSALEEQAKRRGRALASFLWAELDTMGVKTSNRFLACEWLVTPEGELMLNEVKPSQLDKGVLSHFCFDHSDAELFVRNLFRVPMPRRVKNLAGLSVAFAGSILLRDPMPPGGFVTAIGQLGRSLGEGVRFVLYPEKLRSSGYRGRRFGYTMFEGNTFKEVAERWELLKEKIKPEWVILPEPESEPPS